MHFEHVVLVNDPQDPLAENLSREELWFGLLCRVEDPVLFLPGLDRCEIMTRTDNMVHRRLYFGQAVVRDRVLLHPGQRAVFETDQTDEYAGGTLTISIEAPETEILLLRFTYRTTLPVDAGAGQLNYAEYIKSAYRESDIDTVRIIRLLCQEKRTH